MRSHFHLRDILRAALILFLVFPFLFLVGQFRLFPAQMDFAEIFWAFKNSFLQAFLSSFFSLLFGLWCALGLLCFHAGHRQHWRFLLEILCLLPNFLPPLFILLATLNVVDPFPMGLVGIALVHTVMNFGLVAVLLAGIIESKLGGIAELAYVEGASRWLFFTRGFFSTMQKDLLLLGLFIFVICFGSFAVPLVVGGGRGTTVEVLIYEKIRLSSDWGGAVILAFLQSAFIFALTLVANRGKGTTSRKWSRLYLLRMPTGVVATLLISSLYILGYIQGFIAGLPLLSTFYEIQSAILWNFMGTLFVGLSTGILCFLGLMLIAYCWPKAWFEKFLSGYVAPSTSLVCFSLLIFGPNEGWMPFFKIPVALMLLSLNTLFRMGWAGELQSLQPQLTAAYAMGAEKKQIFREILFPQVVGRAGLLSGLAAIWACGDFAVSRVLAHRDLNLAMMTETLMTAYRLNQATVLSSLIILAGFICFIFCVGGSRVLRRKLAV